MNEISLSNQISQIELEINWHKENAGRSVYEIGRRLNHVKDNDLAHGEFEKWLDKMKLSHDQSRKMMTIARELNGESTRHLGVEALYLITQLPEKEKEEELSKAKDGDPSTVREIRELKQQIKQKEAEAEQAKRSEQLAIEQLEREQNKEPEVVTQTVERVVVPDDYKDLERKSRDLEAKVFQMNKQLERIKEIDSYEEKAESIKQEVEYLNGERQKLKHIFDSAEKLQQLEREFNQFFDEKMAPLKYKPLINNLTNTNGVSRMKGMVNLARAWVEDMDNMLPADNRQIIEGEIIND